MSCIFVPRIFLKNELQPPKMKYFPANNGSNVTDFQKLWKKGKNLFFANLWFCSNLWFSVRKLASLHFRLVAKINAWKFVIEWLDRWSHLSQRSCYQLRNWNDDKWLLKMSCKAEQNMQEQPKNSSETCIFTPVSSAEVGTYAIKISFHIWGLGCHVSGFIGCNKGANQGVK